MAAPLAGLAALLMVQFASSAMMRVCDPMLPALAQSFGVSTGRAALTVSAYAVAYGFLQVVFGPLGDRWGKRRMVGWAALGCVAGNLLAVAALDLRMLVAARALAGATAAGIIPLVLAWVGDSVPYEERQATLARFMSASLFGMMAGQWASGLLTEWLGWRAVFVLLALGFAVGGAMILANRAVRAEARQPTRPVPARSALVGVLRMPWARWILLMVAIEGALAFSGLAFLPGFLVRERGLSLSAAAGVVALYGVGGMGYSFAARRLLSRLGEKGLAVGGGMLLALAWTTLALSTGVAVALPACVLAGLGFYALHATLQTHATQMAPSMRGSAVALFAAALFVGISGGVALASIAVDHGAWRALFLACGLGLAALGAVFSSSLARRDASASAAS